MASSRKRREIHRKSASIAYSEFIVELQLGKISPTKLHDSLKQTGVIKRSVNTFDSNNNPVVSSVNIPKLSLLSMEYDEET